MSGWLFSRKKCSAVVSVAIVACVAHGFEVFSEQQLLVLNDPTRVIDFNNSEYGSTHVDDYWAKIDLNYSPLEGWSLFRHVRIGCFLVQWASSLAYAERVGETLTATECVQFCNGTQAYLRLPLCRCGLDETALPMIEVQGECTTTAWEVYRQFDYRSSMSPSTYDVTRRLLYSIVTIRLPSPADPPLRNYIHAVNPLESRPQFDYDTRLDRMVFNAVWDFGKSRMVALSLSDWGGTLDLTVVTFNSSTSGLEVQQSHFPIEDQIVANGELVRDGLASVEGLGTVDVLFGTYYTVVPAAWSSSTQVVHVVVAIDIDMKRVLTSEVMPVTSMNLQMNSLTHELYGAGADLNDQYAYYHLCTAANLTQTFGGVTTVQVFVSCTLAELGGLPSEVNYMYLQSAAIDHQFNFAWFTFKEEPTGTPRILEYQHNSKDYLLWPQETLPDNAVFSSLIQTAPRIIFALYPPALQYARFNSAGTKLFLSFDVATLRGAVPIDTNGDDIPDFYNEADKATRGPCEDFIDRFTMILIPGSMCQWITDADFYVEIQLASTISPGDLARIKPGTVYRGQEARAGVYQFSQPSSDFAVVEAPLDIPTPRAEVGGLAYMDVCTELVLDGTQSRDHGFRGAFTWALSSTTPEKPEPHLRQLQQIVESAMAAEAPVAAQVIRIPPYVMQGNTTYNFSLTVQSFWNPALSDTTYYSVVVSPLPVPPMVIYGSYSRQLKVENSLTLVSEIFFEGCAEALGRGAVQYEWKVCKRNDTVPLLQDSIEGCRTWGSGINLEEVSGIFSRSLYVRPLALQPLETYIFTVHAQVTVNNLTETLQNAVSVEVEAVLGDLLVEYYGGNGFSTRRDRVVVVDFSESRDFSDPAGELSTTTYTYSCQKEGTQDPCFATQGPSIQLTADDCTDVDDIQTGQSMTFTYRNRDYNHAEGISLGELSNVVQHCKESPTSFIFQPNLFETGTYLFVVNGSKVVGGAERVQSSSLYIEVQADTEIDPERTPLVAVFLESPQPVFAGSTLRLRGDITNPQNDTSYTFRWTAYRYGLNPAYDAEAASLDPTYAIPQYTWVPLSLVDFNISDSEQVRTPPDSPYLVVSPNVLIAGLRYRMRVSVLDKYMLSQGIEDYLGFAEFTFLCAGRPPSGGELIVSNMSGTALQTEFVFSMEGFGSEDLPLTYRFCYIQDYDMPFAEAVELNIAYTEQNFIKTRLPQGLVGSQNLLRVVGIVRSSRGATAHASVEVSVSPPGQQAITDIVDQVPLVDPETAIFFTTLLADTEAASEAEVSNALQVTRDKMFVTNRTIASTPEMVSTVSDMLTSVIDKGITTDEVVDFVGTMVNLSLDLSYIASDATQDTRACRGNRDCPLPEELVDVTLGLLYALDAIIPGVVPSYEEATARRLKGGRGMGGKVPWQWTRRLQTSETRDAETMYRQFLQATAMTKQLTDEIHSQIYPGEAPISFALPGQDIFVGKAFIDADEETQNYAGVANLFDLPSLERGSFDNPYNYFNYRYVQFKKFPYDFLVMPGNRSLEAPVPANESRPEVQSLVPPQNISPSERLWHAISLIITDGAGESNLLERSIENVTYSMLPKIAAYDTSSFGNVENPSTCYWVDLGSGNFTEAAFDARGSIFSEDSCITMHTGNFIVLADDLAAQLDVVQQQSPGELLSQYEDDFTTTANVVSATLVLVACAGFVMVSVYVDEHDASNKVTPLDSLRTQVIDREDPKEKVLGTIFQAMRRNHLVIGWNYFHLKLTRVRRAGIFVVAIFATEALAVLQHSLLAFKADSAWGASGLVAAVLVFPLVQFLEFCFEWLPQSRVLSRPPPRSAPAKPIPLKEQAQPKVCKFPKRPAVGKVRPPQPKALPRVEQSLQLPVMPLLQLSKATGQSLKRPQPPALPPGQLPRPPQEPPPVGHLIARSKNAVPEPALTGSGFSELSRQLPGTIGPFGLTLPELPPLPQGNLKAIADGMPMPAPPPKGAAGPRPPKTPPPMNKMFFVTPKGVQMAVPPVPALPSSQPRTHPPLPKLPPVRQTAQLSTVRSGGDSARVQPPPPPPPVPPIRSLGKSAGISLADAFPAAPPTPQGNPSARSELISSILPGTVGLERELPEVVEPAPPEDVEVPDRSASLVLDPEHTMPAPHETQREASSSPSPSRRRRPVIASSSTTGEVDLPHTPSPMPKAQAHMPLSLPGTMKAPPSHSNALSVPRFPMPMSLSQSINLPPASDTSPLRFAGSLRLDVPKQAPLDVPSSVLLRVPQVQKHSSSSSVPPPPPPLVPPPTGPKRHGADMAPIPPESDEPLIAVRKLNIVRPGQVSTSSRAPQPPPNMPGKATLLPTPPAGPPPAHAIVLAKGRPQDFASGNVDLQAVVSKAKPPAPLVHPPSEPLPSFVYRAPSQALQSIADARGKSPKASALEPLPPKAPPANESLAFAALPNVAREYVPPEQGPRPVPEVVVKVSVWIVYVFVFWIFVHSVAIIALYGVYMSNRHIWATYAATFCGCLLNFGILESMKCVILGCVELVKHETVKRQAELDARRTRMALKEQRQLERRARMQESQKMHAPPPLMG